MKTSPNDLFLLFFAFLVLSVLPAQAKQTNTTKNSAPAQQSGNIPASNFEQQLIVVEDLTAEVHSDSGTITIFGKVKNVSRTLISGYATIHLLSGEGKRILSYEEELNGGDVFAHGTTIEFEITARVGDIKKISSISVDFTET